MWRVQFEAILDCSIWILTKISLYVGLLISGENGDLVPIYLKSSFVGNEGSNLSIRQTNLHKIPYKNCLNCFGI